MNLKAKKSTHQYKLDLQQCRLPFELSLPSRVVCLFFYEKMNKLFCVLVFFCCLSAAFAITFDVCGSPTAEIGTVEVSGCTDTDDVCPFKKNTYVNMTADFTAG